MGLGDEEGRSDEDCCWYDREAALCEEEKDLGVAGLRAVAMAIGSRAPGCPLNRQTRTRPNDCLFEHSDGIVCLNKGSVCLFEGV